MGRFFSNLQIKKNVNQSQSEFVKTLSNAMKKLGYVKAEEDEAELSYIAAFSRSKQWVTLCAEDYVSDAEKLNTDAQKIAANLKTFCISNTVIDSDVAVLDMYAGQEERADRVIIGYGEAYGLESHEEAKGKRELWEPLMADENLWDKFSEIQSSDFTFAEDGLVKISEILGISPDLLVADYDELSSVSEDNKAVVPLYFKKAGTKPLSLNAAFVKVFGETLEPLGFKKIKGRHPYLVRVVPGGEIIHIIAIRNGAQMDLRKKAFDILIGAATVYRRIINLDVAPTENINWIRFLDQYYTRSQRLNVDKELLEKIQHFQYFKENQDDMLRELKFSLEMTKQYVLPILDKVNTLDECIYFFRNYAGEISTNIFNSKFNFDLCTEHDEGMLYIKTDNQKLQEDFQNTLSGKTGASEETRQRVAIKNMYFNDPEIHGKALKELEKRKALNTEILKSYGLMQSDSKKTEEKPLSLNAAFVKVFGEALEPLGFKKIKGRHPYLVRVIGDEIIQVITFMSGYDNSFQILGGVATVYRPYIALDKSARDNSNWLINNLGFHELTNPDDCNLEFRRSIHQFYYYDNKGIYKKGTYTPNGELRKSTLEAFEEALIVTNKIMLPVLHNVTSLDDCVTFFDKFKMYMWLFDNDIRNQNSICNYNEGLLLIKTEQRNFFRNKLKEYLDKKYDNNLVLELEKQIELYDSILNDKKAYTEILEELEKRKALNTEILKSYGLDV